MRYFLILCVLTACSSPTLPKINSVDSDVAIDTSTPDVGADSETDAESKKDTSTDPEFAFLTIEVETGDPVQAVGVPVHVAVWGVGQDDERVELTQSLDLVWSLSEPEIAEITPVGVVTASAPGTTQLRVEFEKSGLSATVNLAFDHAVYSDVEIRAVEFPLVAARSDEGRYPLIEGWSVLFQFYADAVIGSQPSRQVQVPTSSIQVDHDGSILDLSQTEFGYVTTAENDGDATLDVTLTSTSGEVWTGSVIVRVYPAESVIRQETALNFAGDNPYPVVGAIGKFVPIRPQLSVRLNIAPVVLLYDLDVRNLGNWMIPDHLGPLECIDGTLCQAPVLTAGRGEVSFESVVLGETITASREFLTYDPALIESVGLLPTSFTIPVDGQFCPRNWDFQVVDPVGEVEMLPLDHPEMTFHLVLNGERVPYDLLCWPHPGSQETYIFEVTYREHIAVGTVIFE